MYFFKGGKPSGKEVNEMKSELQSDLLAGFVQEEGQEVSQRNVMSCLAFGEDYAALLTRAIKHGSNMVVFLANFSSFGHVT